jgi:hypothetical protein
VTDEPEAEKTTNSIKAAILMVVFTASPFSGLILLKVIERPVWSLLRDRRACQGCSSLDFLATAPIISGFPIKASSLHRFCES